MDSALASIRDHKALRCDGYNVVFFKKVWPTVRTDIFNAINNFFITS